MVSFLVEDAEKIADEKKINFYNKQLAAQRYAFSFFENLKSLEQNHYIENKLLPLVIYDNTDEKLKSIQSHTTGMSHAHFIYCGEKQAAIYVGLGNDESKLIYNEKISLKHEIIHYTLWLNDLPCEDDSLIFWVVAYAYNAEPYEPLCESDRDIFELFAETCDLNFSKYFHTPIYSEIIAQVVYKLKLKPDYEQAEFVEVIDTISDEFDAKYGDKVSDSLKKKVYEFDYDLCVLESESELEKALTVFLDAYLGEDGEYAFEVTVSPSDSDEGDYNDICLKLSIWGKIKNEEEMIKNIEGLI